MILSHLQRLCHLALSLLALSDDIDRNRALCAFGSDKG